MKLLLLVTIVTVIIFSIWRYRTRSGRRKKDVSLTAMPSNFSLHPTPLLAEDEVALYNLLRMVVQERYLVFAKVPLGSFLRVDATGERIGFKCSVILPLNGSTLRWCILDHVRLNR